MCAVYVNVMAEEFGTIRESIPTHSANISHLLLYILNIYTQNDCDITHIRTRARSLVMSMRGFDGVLNVNINYCQVQ